MQHKSILDGIINETNNLTPDEIKEIETEAYKATKRFRNRITYNRNSRKTKNHNNRGLVL